MIEKSQLKKLIRSELSSVADPAQRDRLTALMWDDPRPMICAWDYGLPDETYSCWCVAGSPGSDRVGVVYCESGFGPKNPWGLIFLHDAVPRMGMDSAWFPTLPEALLGAFDVPA